jgi:hypothetical protein
MTSPTDLPELATLVNGWANDVEARRQLGRVAVEMRVLVAAINRIVAPDNVAQRNMDEDGREVANCRQYNYRHHRHVWGGDSVEFRCEGESAPKYPGHERDFNCRRYGMEHDPHPWTLDEVVYYCDGQGFSARRTPHGSGYCLNPNHPAGCKYPEL